MDRKDCRIIALIRVKVPPLTLRKFLLNPISRLTKQYRDHCHIRSKRFVWSSVLRNSESKSQTFFGRLKQGLFPVIAGTALFLTYPTLISYQDIASLTRTEASVTSGMRWLVSLNPEPGVSNLTTGSIVKGAQIQNAVASADTDQKKRISFAAKLNHSAASKSFL